MNNIDNRIQERRQYCYKKLIQSDLPVEFVYAYCTEWAEGDEKDIADERAIKKKAPLYKRIEY